jgi:hypothetical protein
MRRGGPCRETARCRPRIRRRSSADCRVQTGDPRRIRVLRAHLAPGQKARAQWRIARGQRGVHDQQAAGSAAAPPSAASGPAGRPSPAPPAPRCAGPAAHQFQQHLAVPAEAVAASFLGLSLLPKPAGRAPPRGPPPPGRWGSSCGTGSSRPGCRAGTARCAAHRRAFVQVVHAQAASAGRSLQVVGRPGVAGQVVKAQVGVRRHLRAAVTPQRGLLRGVAGKRRSAGAAFVCQHAAVPPGLVVDAALGKQVKYRAGGAGLGSGAPNTTRASRACSMAPLHMAQGSSVTYSVQPSSR